ncbi:MAG: two-component regulator propeller domain-containing protein, partial [Luteimonas sp.]
MGLPFARPAVGCSSIGPVHRIVLLVLLCCCAMLSAHAAERDYYFAHAGGEYALAQNTVTALLQDEDGFIWVGTQGGLHRYDGQRYILYRQDPRDPDSLPDSFITALAQDHRHGLWIGTYSQSVARLDLRSGRIRRYPVSAGRSRTRDQQVLALLADDGKVWIGTPGGLEQLDPASGQRRMESGPISRSAN